MIIENLTPISKFATSPEYQKLFEDLQGNILKSHSRPHVHLLCLQFQGPAEAIQTCIKERIVPHITSMAAQFQNTLSLKENGAEHIDAGFLSFSLSKSGYEAIGLSPDQLTNEPSFLNGMKSQSITNDPPLEDWEAPYQEEVHGLLILADDSKENLGNRVDALKDSLPINILIIAEEEGDALPGEKEHFGFVDGISQPRYFLEDQPALKHHWNPFAALNLSLSKDPFGTAFNGGMTGQGSFPVDDNSGDHSFGSFLVYRKLEQDLPGWDQAVLDIAQQLGIPPGLAAAYAVGRFQDGTPVTNHSISTGAHPIENDFDYSNDMEGMKCPFHAHIRKTNPRGDTQDEEEKSRRITRRGIPYNQKGKKGLLFMCYQSSIERQFDFMQNRWADAPSFLKAGTGIDTVIGQGNTNPQQWPDTHGGNTSTPLSFGQFVAMKGGEYFFTPSISSLESLTSPNL